MMLISYIRTSIVSLIKSQKRLLIRPISPHIGTRSRPDANSRKSSNRYTKLSALITLMKSFCSRSTTVVKYLIVTNLQSDKTIKLNRRFYTRAMSTMMMRHSQQEMLLTKIMSTQGKILTKRAPTRKVSFSSSCTISIARSTWGVAIAMRDMTTLYFKIQHFCF